MDVTSNAIMPEWLLIKYPQLVSEAWERMKLSILETFPDAQGFHHETTRHEKLLNSDYEVICDYPVVEMVYIATVDDG